MRPSKPRSKLGPTDADENCSPTDKQEYTNTPHGQKHQMLTPLLFRTSKAEVIFPEHVCVNPIRNAVARPDTDIKVIVRIRPANCREQHEHQPACLSIRGPQSLTLASNLDASTFHFDSVLGPDTTQERLFKMVAVPMVENCLAGYNSSIFAYGQTGSGKTYTMLGRLPKAIELLPEQSGLMVRTFRYLFERIEQLHAQPTGTATVKMVCKCSYLEIYQEQLTDLLDIASSQKLSIREDVRAGVFVEGLRQEEVHTASDALELLMRGSAHRHLGETRANRESSRSHCVFTIKIEARCTDTSGSVRIRTAQLHLVDLAGSERQKKTNAVGGRLREATSINKSLSALGLVIKKLSDRDAHVPYRDSLITRLLQDSLGGNALTCMVACVSPANSCQQETASTLEFAGRVKQVKNKAVINEDTLGSASRLQAEIQRLKRQLQMYKDAEAESDCASRMALTPLSDNKSPHSVGSRQTTPEGKGTSQWEIRELLQENRLMRDQMECQRTEIANLEMQLMVVRQEVLDKQTKLELLLESEAKKDEALQESQQELAQLQDKLDSNHKNITEMSAEMASREVHMAALQAAVELLACSWTATAHRTPAALLALPSAGDTPPGSQVSALISAALKAQAQASQQHGNHAAPMSASRLTFSTPCGPPDPTQLPCTASTCGGPRDVADAGQTRRQPHAATPASPHHCEGLDAGTPSTLPINLCVTPSEGGTPLATTTAAMLANAHRASQMLADALHTPICSAGASSWARAADAEDGHRSSTAALRRSKSCSDSAAGYSMAKADQAASNNVLTPHSIAERLAAETPEIQQMLTQSGTSDGSSTVDGVSNSDTSDASTSIVARGKWKAVLVSSGLPAGAVAAPTPCNSPAVLLQADATAAGRVGETKQGMLQAMAEGTALPQCSSAASPYVMSTLHSRLRDLIQTNEQLRADNLQLMQRVQQVETATAQAEIKCMEHEQEAAELTHSQLLLKSRVAELEEDLSQSKQHNDMLRLLLDQNSCQTESNVIRDFECDSDSLEEEIERSEQEPLPATLQWDNDLADEQNVVEASDVLFPEDKMAASSTCTVEQVEEPSPPLCYARDSTNCVPTSPQSLGVDVACAPSTQSSLPNGQQGRPSTEELTDRLAEAQAQLLEVSRQRDSARLMLEAERRATAMRAERLDQLQGELQTKDEQITVLEQKVMQQQDMQAQAQMDSKEEIHSKERQLQRLEQEYQHLHTKLATLQSEATLMRQSVSRRQEVEDQNQALRNTVHALEAQYSHLDPMQQQLDLKLARDRETRLRGQLTTLRQKVQEERASMDQVLAEKTALAGRVRDLESYKHNLDLRLTRFFGSTLEDLRRQMQAQLSQQCDSYKQVMSEQYREQMAHKQAQITVLESELEVLTDELDTERENCTRMQWLLQLQQPV